MCGVNNGKKRCDNRKPCWRCIKAGLEDQCENAPARRKPQKRTVEDVTEPVMETAEPFEGDGEGGLYLLAKVAAEY